MGRLAKLFKYFDKKERAYLSPTDLFLQEFEQKHPEKSASQVKEIAKHKNIFYRSIDQRIKW